MSEIKEAIMSRLLAKLFILSVLFCLSACSMSGNKLHRPISQTDVQSFSQIEPDVATLNAKYGADNVLIVLDIDNTILTNSVDIGSDIWYQWQRRYLDLKPDDSQEVKCLFEDSIGLLYELSPMLLTEANLPELISRWQNNNTVFALTSRAPKYRAATERELINKGIDFDSSALSPLGQNTPVYREKLAREFSYMKGIMMTSGMNKGEMLSFILAKTKRSFDAIVFVDDSEKNIINVFNQFKNQTDVETHIYHYVKIEQQRELEFGAVLTKQQADKMTNDWLSLNKTLNAIFPNRNKSGQCLAISE
jgi:hypothetical protein